jgi:hypothetical protein
MVVYKRPDSGGILLWSAVALEEEEYLELDGLGRVETIIVPNERPAHHAWMPTPMLIATPRRV